MRVIIRWGMDDDGAEKSLNEDTKMNKNGEDGRIIWFRPRDGSDNCENWRSLREAYAHQGAS